jgi:RsiW-degrading membrane proteinase PrsW (M82 family)
MLALLTGFFFGFVPMFLFAYILYWLDRYEKEPLLLLGGVFLWGVVVAAGGAYILNSLFGISVFVMTGDEFLSEVATSSLSAPLIEESLKGLAVLLVFIVFRKEFDSVLDGIIYAGISALGFAATENTIYILRGYQSGGWSGLFMLTFIRVILVGWQHPVYTSFTGIGLALARTNRSWFVKILAPLAGWGMAMFTHGFHNFLASVPLLGEATCFIGLILDWIGVFFVFLLILWATWREQKLLKTHLREEVSLGLITPAQYRTASSGWAQMLARMNALFSKNYRSTKRFYQVCGELAHKKQQYLTLGDEEGNHAIIQGYRAELERLSPHARA